jgi:hypothetical protein
VLDDILSVLSVMGKISFEKFKEIYEILLKNRFNEDEQQRLIYSHYDLLRDLEAMGYCEVDYVNRKVFICPPSFALLPCMGLPKIVLSGGRTDKIVSHLSRLASKNSDKININYLEQYSAKSPLFPKTIFVEAKSLSIIKQVVDKVGLEGNIETPASFHLTMSSPNVSEIINNLRFSEMIEPNWKSMVFCRGNLYFKQFNCSDEYKLINYTNPISQQQYTWIWNKKYAANIDRDWGRYAILHHFRKKILLFDPIKQRFAVPSTTPLPKQLSRAAIFSTGYLPRYKVLRKEIGNLHEDRNLTVYEGISESLALDISKKLGLELLEANLS